jgi:hypothetical protein
MTYSADVIKLEGISIQGNSEEPNVLYITPWQEAPGAEYLFSPVKSYRDQWLKPTSRKSMKREINYLNDFEIPEETVEGRVNE